MARAFYHEHPDTCTVDTEIVEARPGGAVLSVSPLYPGGGGQVPDPGVLRWSGGEVAVTGFTYEGGRLWHLLADPALEVSGKVQAAVDPAFRQMMRELHTATHILNAIIFKAFNGALVTGAQLNADGTARLDFDIREPDNDRLRALEGPINDAVKQALPVVTDYIPLDSAYDEPGLLRSKSVTPPPTADGLIRIVEIQGLDRQACGGTHLSSTGNSRPIKILKIDNKGRQNRRVRIGLVGVT